MDNISSWATAVLGFVSLVVGGLVAIAIKARSDWAKSKTNALMEAAQQSGLSSVIAALTSSQVREKEAWGLVSQARIDHDSLMNTMGVMREDIAELRTREDACQRELQSFRNQLETIAITHRDERRRDANKIANQKHLIGVQSRTIRDLGGDPNITAILGDI